MKGIEPAHRTLVYSIDADGEYDIDIAKDLSAINRRLYRQGMQYYVSSVRIAAVPTPTASYIYLMCATAGDTWMVHNAWKKGYSLWRSQVNEVKEMLPSIEGKWADFKVKLDDASSTLLQPVCSDVGTIVGDEWNLSQFYWDDDGAEDFCTFNLIGATNIGTEASLVQEYHISRAQTTLSPIVPSEAADSMYAKSLHMQDELSEDLIDEISADNDQAPYDSSEMVGGDTVADAPFLHGFSISTPASAGHHSGFLAECGLVRIAVSAYAADGSSTDIPSDSLIFVEIAPGPYKGVMASRMGQ